MPWMRSALASTNIAAQGQEYTRAIAMVAIRIAAITTARSKFDGVSD
jgi:hypothetical protein